MTNNIDINANSIVVIEKLMQNITKLTKNLVLIKSGDAMGKKKLKIKTNETRARAAADSSDS